MIDRDDIEDLDPALVPIWRSFPIPAYTAILASGKAAATKKRYRRFEDAEQDCKTVIALLAYYRKNHPELAPVEFGRRVWESREDGQWRWAIVPTVRPRRLIRHDRRPLGRAR